ncbi:hypothetical protein CEXT_394721 [Caerostris extrusa]|uniref:Uncharacterized protein n=1 Tax=Caerostris extrusa TaxID=172846 RepID=A0AAV4Y5R9_CAEEX|nr:hypothetical protein CEXT_394721 [Caerostris extrusa]
MKSQGEQEISLEGGSLVREKHHFFSTRKGEHYLSCSADRYYFAIQMASLAQLRKGNQHRRLPFLRTVRVYVDSFSDGYLSAIIAKIADFNWARLAALYSVEILAETTRNKHSMKEILSKYHHSRNPPMPTNRRQRSRSLCEYTTPERSLRCLRPTLRNELPP